MLLCIVCTVRRHASATVCVPVNLVLVGRWLRWQLVSKYQEVVSRFVGTSTVVSVCKMNELVQTFNTGTVRQINDDNARS